MTITASPFGVTASGAAVTLYTMTNDNGMAVKVLDRGCIVQSILVPDKNGNTVDVALGYDTVAAYEAGTCFYGAFVGRYANRIGGSRFVLNGETVQLTPNEGPNHLHGVYCGSFFYAQPQGNSLVLRRTSPAGEEGYPGKLELTVTYTLTDDNALIMDYQATADGDTVVNLTNHTYFNLSGHDSGSAQEQVLQIRASKVTAVGEGSIPTGENFDVTGTPFDFRTPKPIGRDLDLSDPQLALTEGYDHNFVLDTTDMSQPFAVAYSPATGIAMDCYTTQPGVQFYNANFVQDDPSMGQGKGGAAYVQRSAFCLETQHFPDSPNQPAFPSTVVKAGETYHQTTKYQFSVR
ncbi:MAG: galactose mutarotase [Clostridiales bacterium]|nr:galactose mutarotase [Clostridiales bacterium]